VAIEIRQKLIRMSTGAKALPGMAFSPQLLNSSSLFGFAHNIDVKRSATVNGNLAKYLA
jgi:hypothetical protein